MDTTCEIRQTDILDIKESGELPASACTMSTNVEITNKFQVKDIPRQLLKPVLSSSDSDDSDDSDDDALRWKRPKHSKKTSTEAVMLNSRSCEAFSLCAAKFAEDRRLGPKPNASKFNVWSNVLAEQGLVEDLNSVGVEYLKYKNDRGCEGYNYALKNKYQGGDGRPLWQQDSQEIHRRLGCKRSAKERLGELSMIKKNKRTFCISESDPEEVVVSGIATILREPKQELIARAVKTIGKKKALEILAMVEDIEECGGMMTADESRRRTPGGIFLLLLRNDYDITRVQLDAIFEEDRKLQAMAKKDITRAKRRKAAKMLSDDQDLPILPTLPELLLKEQERKLKLSAENDTKDKMEVNAGDDVQCDSEKEAGEIDSD